LARFLILTEDGDFIAEVEADTKFQVLGLYRRVLEEHDVVLEFLIDCESDPAQMGEPGYVVDCATDERHPVKNGSLSQDTTKAMLRSMVSDDDPEWRCTRPELYGGDNSANKNPRHRQGHYIRAPNEEVARLLMNHDFPGEKIDVERWKN
jgi:hypothetical protein